MTFNAHTFDLLLLTASKEVGLRRWRSFGAALGGGAIIHHSVDLLRHSLGPTPEADAGQRIIVNDGTIRLTPAELASLRKVGRLYQIYANPPGPPAPPGTPAEAPQLSCAPPAPFLSEAGVELETSLACSMPVFLESPIVRASMAHMCKSIRPFHLQHLLRWGHTAQTWTASALVPATPGIATGDGASGRRPRMTAQGITDASFAFIRSLCLAGDGRRLVETFTHFILTGLGAFGLSPQRITFGADGLLVLVSIRCEVQPDSRVLELTHELRLHGYPATIINRLPGGDLEIGCCHHQLQAQLAQNERIFMVFDQRAADTRQTTRPAPPLPPALNKAG